MSVNAPPLNVAGIMAAPESVSAATTNGWSRVKVRAASAFRSHDWNIVAPGDDAESRCQSGLRRSTSETDCAMVTRRKGTPEPLDAGRRGIVVKEVTARRPALAYCLTASGRE